MLGSFDSSCTELQYTLPKELLQLRLDHQRFDFKSETKKIAWRCSPESGMYCRCNNIQIHSTQCDGEPLHTWNPTYANETTVEIKSTYLSPDLQVTNANNSEARFAFFRLQGYNDLNEVCQQTDAYIVIDKSGKLTIIINCNSSQTIQIHSIIESY